MSACLCHLLLERMNLLCAPCCYTQKNDIETSLNDDTPIRVTMDRIVPKAQIVRFEEEAEISDEFVMCTAPNQPSGFDKTSNTDMHVLQVDIGAPCTVFMMRDNGNLIVVRPNSTSGVKVVRSLAVAATSSDEAFDETSTALTGKPRKTSVIGTRKTSVKGLLIPEDLETSVAEKSHPGRQKGTQFDRA